MLMGNVISALYISAFNGGPQVCCWSSLVAKHQSFCHHIEIPARSKYAAILLHSK